jgi:hypothetical protein
LTIPDFPTRADLFRILRDEVLSQNAKLSLEAVERDGTDANVLLAASAEAGDEVVGQLVRVAAGQFLDSAEGQLLDRLVFDRYGLVRKPASPALGTVEFTTTVANPAAFTIPANTLLQTADGIQYTTVDASTFPIASTGPVYVQVRSVLAGLDQQAKKNTITSIVTPITGSPADLAVNNSIATSGADDAESDASLRERARRFFTTARRGTLTAIEQGALAVPGVRRATAIEVIDVLGRPARLVQLIIADAFTDALVEQDVDPPTYQTQSQALSQAVFSSLSDVRAAGIFVQVFVAQVVLQPVILQLRFQAGVNADQTALVARASVVAATNDLLPGEIWAVADMLDILSKVPGLAPIQGDEVSSPAGDVVPKALQVIRTSLNLVTVQPIQTDNSNPVLTPTTNPDAFLIRYAATPVG